MPARIALFLIRHAIAEERGDAWPDDDRRPLTEAGANSMRKAARGLARLGVRFDVVLTSPLVRARQTADILAGAFEDHPPVVSIDSLKPGGTYADVLSDLQKQSRRKSIALVGHQPDLGELAARLAGSRRAFDFRKGGACRIDVESLPPARPGTLRWFVPPSVLRAVRK